MHVRNIALAVRSAFGELSQAYNWCWPGGNKRDANERNLSLYIAHKLRDRDFFTFHEAALDRNSTHGTQLDLLAIQVETGVVVAVESKRLYNVGQLGGMARDYERVTRFLESFEPSKTGDYDVKHRIGVLAAFTRNRNYADWWCFGETGSKPKDSESRKWIGLDEADKQHPEGYWDNMPMWRTKVKENNEEYYEDVYGLFFVFEVKPKANEPKTATEALE